MTEGVIYSLKCFTSEDRLVRSCDLGSRESSLVELVVPKNRKVRKWINFLCRLIFLKENFDYASTQIQAHMSFPDEVE